MKKQPDPADLVYTQQALAQACEVSATTIRTLLRTDATFPEPRVVDRRLAYEVLATRTWFKARWDKQRNDLLSCGTAASYRRGCRCQECTAANTAKVKDQVVRRRESVIASGRACQCGGKRCALSVDDRLHGRTSGYVTYRCRCPLCRAAGSAKNAEYRARKAAAA